LPSIATAHLRGYIIKGKGLMIIEDESKEVVAGDVVYIPSNMNHGIKNIGEDVLEYLTANAPVFSEQYENTLWPTAPLNSRAELAYNK